MTPKLIVLSVGTQEQIASAYAARRAYVNATLDGTPAARDAWIAKATGALEGVVLDKAFGVGASETPDPQIDLIAKIEAERTRLGMSSRSTLRIGTQTVAGVMLATAGLSLNAGSRFYGGHHARTSVIAALESLLAELRVTGAAEPEAAE